MAEIAAALRAGREEEVEGRAVSAAGADESTVEEEVARRLKYADETYARWDTDKEAKLLARGLGTAPAELEEIMTTIGKYGEKLTDTEKNALQNKLTKEFSWHDSSLMGWVRREHIDIDEGSRTLKTEWGFVDDKLPVNMFDKHLSHILEAIDNLPKKTSDEKTALKKEFISYLYESRGVEMAGELSVVKFMQKSITISDVKYSLREEGEERTAQVLSEVIEGRLNKVIGGAQKKLLDSLPENELVDMQETGKAITRYQDVNYLAQQRNYKLKSMTRILNIYKGYYDKFLDKAEERLPNLNPPTYNRAREAGNIAFARRTIAEQVKIIQDKLSGGDLDVEQDLYELKVLSTPHDGFAGIITHPWSGRHGEAEKNYMRLRAEYPAPIAPPKSVIFYDAPSWDKLSFAAKGDETTTKRPELTPSEKDERARERTHPTPATSMRMKANIDIDEWGDKVEEWLTEIHSAYGKDSRAPWLKIAIENFNGLRHPPKGSFYNDGTRRKPPSTIELMDKTDEIIQKYAIKPHERYPEASRMIEPPKLDKKTRDYLENKKLYIKFFTEDKKPHLRGTLKEAEVLKTDKQFNRKARLKSKHVEPVDILHKFITAPSNKNINLANIIHSKSMFERYFGPWTGNLELIPDATRDLTRWKTTVTPFLKGSRIKRAIRYLGTQEGMSRVWYGFAALCIVLGAGGIDWKGAGSNWYSSAPPKKAAESAVSTMQPSVADSAGSAPPSREGFANVERKINSSASLPTLISIINNFAKQRGITNVEALASLIKTMNDLSGGLAENKKAEHSNMVLYIVLGVVAFIILLLLLLWIFRRRIRRLRIFP